MGRKYASTVVCALIARSAVGDRYASTVVYAMSARSAVGHRYASTVVGAMSARSATRRNSSCIKTKGISRYRWLPLLVASLAWLVWLALLRRRLTRPAPPTPRGGEPNDADSGAPIGARDPYVPLILR